MELILALAPHVRMHGLGTLYSSPADLVLGEDEVLQPDLFVAPPTATPRKQREEITALRLVIEIVSPSSARTDRHQKRLRYQRAGVPHYWVVDPEQHQIEVWRPESEAGAVWRERMVWRVPAEAPLVMDLRGVFAG